MTQSEVKEKYMVIRKACLMEDEGQDHFDHFEDSLESAKKWVSEQEGKYFSPSDYKIYAIVK